MVEPKNKCMNCGSEEVFVILTYNNSGTEKDIYRCFECYCKDYENYIRIDNNDDEDYM
jgi:hypothetical protein